jgi:hypothetical protein
MIALVILECLLTPKDLAGASVVPLFRLRGKSTTGDSIKRGRIKPAAFVGVFPDGFLRASSGSLFALLFG